MMNLFRRTPLGLVVLLLLWAAASGASVGAWAHGGEEHGHDAPASPAAAIPAAPEHNKLLLSDDTLELVVQVVDRALLIYVDRFGSNQPLTGADLTLELDGAESGAREIRPGLYRVDAPWAASAGAYELLLTIDADAISDLLIGVLEISDASPLTDAARSTPGDLAAFPGWRPDGWQWGVAALTLLVVLLIALKVRPRQAVTTTLVALALLLSAPDPLWAHGGEDHSAAAQDAASALPLSGDRARRLPSGEVYLPKPNQRTLQILTQIAAPEAVPASYQLTAHVVASPNHSGQVQAAQNGRIDTSRVPLPHIGQWVEQGQVLSHILPIAARFEQGNQQAQQAELSSALRLAEQRHGRLLKLQGSVPQKEIDEAQNQVDSLKARLAAVVKSLRGLEPLYAPIAGYITAVEATPGQIVEGQSVLFQIVDPTRMQVEALAYDRQTTLLESAYSVNRAGDRLELSLLGIGVNLKGHAIPMLFEVVADNPPLAIGEALTVYVSGQQRTEGVVLPRASLVKGGQGEDLVWTHPQAERFAPRAVRWSSVDRERIAVTDGLHEGDRVVVQGATLLSQIR